jgi:hypothetical protein
MQILVAKIGFLFLYEFLSFFLTSLWSKLKPHFCPSRQTDNMTTERSTWWSVTAFNDEIASLKDTERYPIFVKTIHGGLEKCPETGTIHFQGAIQCHSQQRLSAFKSWIPTAHLEPARSAEALRRYAMKADTAIENKEVRKAALPHFTCQEIMSRVAYELVGSSLDVTDSQTDTWKAGINMLLSHTPELAGQLQNPSNRGFWKLTQWTWLQKAHEKKAAEAKALDSITQRHANCKHGLECGGCLACEEYDGLNAPHLNIIINDAHDTSPAPSSPPRRRQKDDWSCENQEELEDGQSDRQSGQSPQAGD